MIKNILDTNICIYIIKRKPIEVIRRLQEFNVSEIAISAVTLSELEYGVYKSTKPEQNKVALAEFLSPIDVISFDDKASEVYGKIRSKLEKQGTPIGPFDTLIGAHVLSLDCTLVTNNVKEFKRIDNLKIENWVD